MFYQVRILGAKGELKKVINSKKLSDRFWRKHSQPLEFSGKSGADDGEFELESDWDNRISSKKKNPLSNLVDEEFDTFE